MSSHEPETIEVTENRVACDGGVGALGHPRVWLSIDPATGITECRYCGRRFVLQSKAGAGH